MTDRCEHLTTVGDDGVTIDFRAQVHGDLTDADRDALGEIARAAIRHLAALPGGPNEPPCPHGDRFHRDGVCVVRRPEPCGCAGVS